MSMKISKTDFLILKNFAGINQSILFKDGGILATISPQKEILASAELSDLVIERDEGEAPIYDLTKFLRCVEMLEKNDTLPEINFGQDKIVLKNGSSEITYQYCEKNLIIYPPKNEIPMKGDMESFNVSWGDLSSAIASARVLGVDTIALRGSPEDGIIIETHSTQNRDADKFKTKISDTCNSKFFMYTKTENFKFLKRDYKVTISSSKIGKFEADDVMYQIAFNHESTFEEVEE